MRTHHHYITTWDLNEQNIQQLHSYGCLQFCFNKNTSNNMAYWMYKITIVKGTLKVWTVRSYKQLELQCKQRIMKREKKCSSTHRKIKQLEVCMIKKQKAANLTITWWSAAIWLWKHLTYFLFSISGRALLENLSTITRWSKMKNQIAIRQLSWKLYW